jgi:hypothetical protein
MVRRTFEDITNDGEGIFGILPPVGVIFMLPDDTFLIVQYIPCDAFIPGRTMLEVLPVNMNVVDCVAAVNVSGEPLMSEMLSRDVT